MKGLTEQDFDEMDKYPAVESEPIYRAMIEQAMREKEDFSVYVVKMNR